MTRRRVGRIGRATAMDSADDELFCLVPSEGESDEAEEEARLEQIRVCGCRRRPPWPPVIVMRAACGQVERMSASGACQGGR